MSGKRRVLITGAAGAIGTGFAQWAHESYELRLLDLPGRFTENHATLGNLIECDIRDLDALKAAFSGVDTVIHLGGERRPSALWDDLLTLNIVGTYNATAAAIACGCRRLIYASSVHAVSGYPTGFHVRESDPVRPGDLYGVSKVFGEALGSYAAHSEGLSVVALRIGAFQDPATIDEPEPGWMLKDFCAPIDLYRLIADSIDAEDIEFEIFNAVSGNLVSRLEMKKASRQLGFVPEYDAFQLSSPFRNALDAVGTLDDRATLSGMRADISPRSLTAQG